MNLLLVCFLILFAVPAAATDFPADWFLEVPRSEARSWEILPQDAGPGEVILSKRTELGVFSNFAPMPFVLAGKRFASVEGLWQSLKYPDPALPDDPRHGISFPHTREAVEGMVAFAAKDAGNAANRIYRERGLVDVSWGTSFFDYFDEGPGSAVHYDLILSALRAKLDQNPGLWELLLRTRCLELRPDHRIDETDPPSFQYHKMMMKLRATRAAEPCPR
jgi:hypothetical protein